jgi:phage-related minor tail protein
VSSQARQQAAPALGGDVVQTVLLTVQRYLEERYDPKLKALSADIARLRDEVRAVREMVTHDFLRGLIEAVAAERLEAAVRGPVEGALSTIAGKLTVLADMLGEAGRGYGAVSESVDRLSDRVAALERAVEAVSRGVAADTEAVRKRLAELEAGLRELEGKASELGGLMDQLGDRMKSFYDAFAGFAKELEAAEGGQE